MRRKRDFVQQCFHLYILLLFLFLAAPILIVIVVSFNPEGYVRFPPSGVSLRWFQAVFMDKTFVTAIINSGKLAFLATLISLGLGIPAAVALGRYQFPGKYLIEAFLLSPLSLPMIVLGIALLFYVNKIGLGLSFSSLLAGHVVITIPYILRTVVGVYRGMDRTVEEAAMVLGANSWATFYHITLPHLKPGIIAGAIFAFLLSFDNVPVSIFLTTPETTTLPVALLSYLVYNFDPSIAAISTLEMAFVMVAMFIVERLYGLQKLTA
ncbi:MAG: ABC transporter permease, partial [Nitrospinota bacterium]